jgi:hypothetical protein
MFFLNLSAFEFLALFGAVSSFVVALYLLSRSRRKQIVSTLKFWVQAQQPVANKQRRRIQQPWSLVLQLLSICLLLLALAQLRLGSRENSSRDHVLLLDTSSWTAAKWRKGNLLDEAKQRAHEYVRALPSTDRVMVVRAEAVPSPVTGMESNRAVIKKAIDDSRPGASALNMQQAFSFAEQARRLHAQNAGEVVFVGTTRIAENTAPANVPRGLRVVPTSSPGENLGLTKIALRRSQSDAEIWEAFVSVRNYGTATRRVPVGLHFAGAVAGSRVLDVPAARTAETTIPFRTRAAGWIEVRLFVSDALAEDDRAVVEVPPLDALKVTVYTNEPELLRPALAAHPQSRATFRAPSQYSPKGDAAVVILDRFVPPQPPEAASIWISPPARSPFPVRTRVTAAPVVRWRSDHDVSAGLRTRQLRLESSDVYALGDDAVAIAEVEAGPVIVARPRARMIVFGFHPGASGLRYQLATPLLLANTLRWLKPDVFRTFEIASGTVGSVAVPIDGAVDPGKVRVVGERQDLPFTVQGRTLRFFSARPERVRIITGGTEQVYSLSLPEVGAATWTVPASVRRGVPGRFAEAFSRDIWQILAVLAGIGLLAEWLLYGRIAARRRAAAEVPEPAAAAEVVRQAS